MPSVIVGVDDTPAARAVADVGARLAGWLGMYLVLAHAIEEPRALPYADPAQTEFQRRRALREARPILERVDPTAHSDSHRLVFGEPADALQRLVYEESGALIVVGSRGRGTLRAAATNSVSRELAHEAVIPVVVVPPSAARAQTGRWSESIVCGIDSTEESRAAARVACAVASASRLRLVLVHAGDRGDEFGGQRIRVVSGDPVLELDRIATEEDAALIVVGTRGRGAVAEALTGSTASTLAAQAASPVLVVPPGAGIDPALVPAAS